MARPRKNNPSAVITPIIQEFAARLSAAVETFATARIAKQIEDALGGQRSSGRRHLRRAPISCYYPGCRNTAAPRFGMFCAAKHKDLSKVEKLKYRAQRDRRLTK